MNFSTLTPGYYLQVNNVGSLLLCQIHENDTEREMLTFTDIAPITGYPSTLELAVSEEYSYDACESLFYLPVSGPELLSLADYQDLYPEYFL